MITQRKTANAVGGATARACESCLHKRARWYCAADEAFLCQSCDASVHSANQLASRHERVRLETASNFKSTTGTGIENSLPAWLHGFTRKARTPRHPKSKRVQTAPKDEEEKIVNSFPLVPEINSEDGFLDEDDEEEQLLYRVPVFDPFAAELCNIGHDIGNVHAYEPTEAYYLAENGQDEACDHLDDVHGFLPPDDVDLLESLLGTGIEDKPCGIEGLGLIDCKEEEDIGICFEGKNVKVEVHEGVEAILACNMDTGFDMTRETIDWNFDYESPVNGEEEEEQKRDALLETTMIGSSEEEVRNKILLRLNYEGVIAAWANQGSPWTTGSRPEFNPDDCWLDFMGMGSVGMNRPYGGTGGSDGGREARVLRYREKRRTRLFSKKIRYEVRKLNAEKRPRMKGRFVKRTSFAAGPAAAFPCMMKK